VNKLKTLKGACLVAATAMLPLSQAAMAEVTISGWMNEGVTFYDDGASSDAVQVPDNGNTLGTRLTFSASSEVYTGLTAGFEFILEPLNNGALGWGSGASGVNDDDNFDAINVLSSNLHVAGAWGKLTVGMQSMPTDNIAVLEDPSLTLWSGISPIFRGNGVAIQDNGSMAGAIWGNFLGCFTQPVLRGNLGIGLDCNGTYLRGVRYDLPAFGPVTIAIGYANDDVYDIAAKWKGSLGRVKGQIALGYAINQGVNPATLAAIAAAGAATDLIYFKEAENFQVQAGLMDPETGLFGSIAYQNEDNDIAAGAQALVNLTALGGQLSDDSDSWWLKVGIKKQWFSAGDSVLSFDYGEYSDQYGAVQALFGVTGSEVERIGVAVEQYFGSSLIIYGKWEQLDLDVDTTAASTAAFAAVGAGPYGGGVQELDTFTLGAVYFF